MELGNMIFGNSRGRFEVDRGMQDEFYSYLQEMGFDGYGHHDLSNDACVFENEVFWVRPYYWGECVCGYDEREYTFSKSNYHSDACYQAELRQAKLDAGGVCDNDYGYISHPKSIGYDAWNEIERGIYDRLCAKHGLDPKFGCAVHCTCEHDPRWQAWSAENSHDESCPIVQPNFWHKASGFKLEWYKYPLRDSYSNQPLDRKLMRSLMADCIASMRSPAKAIDARSGETVKPARSEGRKRGPKASPKTPTPTPHRGEA